MNQRSHSRPQNETAGEQLTPVKKRCHVLVEFPHPELEAVVVQWQIFRPTVFIQLKRNSEEPLQFPGKRTDMSTNSDLPAGLPAELDQRLKNFINPVNGQPFTDEAFNADIVFSARSFQLLQPEPDLVLPLESLWECRAEALGALNLEDKSIEELIETPSLKPLGG